MQMLSQLSYGPAKPLDCSSEAEIPRPPNAKLLVVPGGLEAQVNLPIRNELVRRKQEALIDLRAIQSEEVELALLVLAVDQARSPAPRRVQPTHDDVADPPRQLALSAP